MKTHSFYCLFLVISISYNTNAINLRSNSQNHQQLQTFADIINNSNHVDQQIPIFPDANPSSTGTTTTTSTTTTQTSNSTGPKVAAGIIIPIICVGLCLIFCFFCLKCAKNQQDQAQQGLQQTIPCYCGPIKLLGKCCRYLLCADIILRCLGIRSTAWEKQNKKRLQEQQKRMKKQQKQRLKYEKKYGNSAVNQSNPYQTSNMQRQNAQPVGRWIQTNDSTESQKLKKQKCQICQKKHPNILTTCPSHCVFHLECLVEYKNLNKMSKTSNLCPNCQSNYYNMVRFYCKKCSSKYSDMQIQSGNVYASVLDYKDAVKSIGGQKCDKCAKKWF